MLRRIKVWPSLKCGRYCSITLSSAPNCGFKYSSTGVPIIKTTILLFDMTDAGPVTAVRVPFLRALRKYTSPISSLKGNLPFLTHATDALFTSNRTVFNPARAKETPRGKPTCPAPPITQISKLFEGLFFINGIVPLVLIHSNGSSIAWKMHVKIAKFL